MIKVRLLVSGAGFFFLGSGLIAELMQILRDSLTIEREQIFNIGAYPLVFLSSVKTALTAVFPLFLLLVIAAILAPMAMGGLDI